MKKIIVLGLIIVSFVLSMTYVYSFNNQTEYLDFGDEEYTDVIV